jgi:hypothetical protein
VKISREQTDYDEAMIGINGDEAITNEEGSVVEFGGAQNIRMIDNATNSRLEFRVEGL